MKATILAVGNSLWGVAPTLRSGKTCAGIVEVKKMEINTLGNIYPENTHQSGNVYGTDGVSPTLQAGVHSYGIPFVTEQQIVAMRGRNPENPSDRTPGANLVQTLEPNSQGISNTITTVPKDNMVLETEHIIYDDYNGNIQKDQECIGTITQTCGNDALRNGKKIIEKHKIKIRQATKDGFIDCEIPGIADLNYVSSQTRRGRVVEGGQISPTLTTENIPSLIELGDPDFYNFLYEIDGEIYLIRIRKLIPRECLRLMDVDEDVIDRMEEVESNTNLYRAAGNSIVVNCLTAIFGMMFEGKEDVYKNVKSAN